VLVILGRMATESREGAATLEEASRQCQQAIQECEALLKRTEEMLLRSAQEIDRSYREESRWRDYSDGSSRHFSRWEVRAGSASTQDGAGH
jgi:hypothetical protein